MGLQITSLIWYEYGSIALKTMRNIVIADVKIQQSKLKSMYHGTNIFILFSSFSFYSLHVELGCITQII